MHACEYHVRLAKGLNPPLHYSARNILFFIVKYEISSVHTIYTYKSPKAIITVLLQYVKVYVKAKNIFTV